MPERVILAVDPGSHKCGVAVVDSSRRVRMRGVVETERLGDRIRELLEAHAVTEIAVGDRTASRRVRAQLSALAGGRPVVPVDEHLSTLEARQRYFQENPPRGLRRLIPLGLQVPPCPIDDLVAVLLAERCLAAGEPAQNWG
ncbi:MAG TPA: pre-16S rRNA-processing nuclease YqgF [Armatimonadetes bacterium]|jgi:RNase H-fold protein (predicted Holliday junction resolvase)|nr:pre-16S rRNA-processing nuclease YqgF [Armatimonadota bacterium]